MSITFKIIVIFGTIVGLAAALAVYSIRSLSLAEGFVVKFHDVPLVAINHARSAHARLNEARVLMQRGLLFRESTSPDLPQELEEIVANAQEDLRVVHERVADAAVQAALTRSGAAIAEWFDLGMTVIKPPPGGVTLLPMTSAVLGKGEIAAAALDELVELTAAFGFDFRQQAAAELLQARRTMTGFAVATGIIGILLAAGLAYSLGRPIRRARNIAERVAAGDLSDKIEVRGRDELSGLLQSLAAMQEALRAKIDEEPMRREQAGQKSKAMRGSSSN